MKISSKLLSHFACPALNRDWTASVPGYGL
jgi:hypothetical protein